MKVGGGVFGGAQEKSWGHEGGSGHDQNISYAYKFLPYPSKTQILIYGCVDGRT